MTQGRSEVTLQTDTGRQAPDASTGDNGNTSADPNVTAGNEGGDEGGEDAGQFGGYATVEELIAAHQALKEGQGSGEGNTGGEGGEGDEGVKDALQAAGLDPETFNKEFAESGDLSDDSRKALEAKGFSRDMVDVYLDGLRARQSTYDAAVFAPAGGEKQYTELLNWASGNLNADEKRAFNDAVSSGDVHRAALAVQGLAAKRGGNKTALLNGKAANTPSGPQPYASNAQVVEAMRDPRYRRDPAYRDEVTARLRVSKVFQ